MFFDRVLDTVDIVLGTHALYYYLINMYGNLLGALEVNIIWCVVDRRYTVDLTDHLSLQEPEGVNLFGVLILQL